MRQVALAALIFAMPSAAGAAVATYTDLSSFQSANPSAAVVENFEDSNPALREMQLANYTGPSGAITFTPIDSTPASPNVFLAAPGHTNFGVGLNPTTSVILTATGNEHFIGTLTTPASALGFDVFENDSPLTISFFNGAMLLGTLTFDSPTDAGNNLGFAGISSSQGITSFEWQATNGENINTGIDNILVAPLIASVPEPSSWAMMLLGFGVIGLVVRRRASVSPSSPKSGYTAPSP